MKQKNTTEYKKMDLDDLIRELNVDIKNGLLDDDIEERQGIYGINAIEEKGESPWRRFFKRFWGPIPWMIEIAAFFSLLAGRKEDFVIIMIMLLVNVFLDFIQEAKAMNTVVLLKKKIAQKALVKRNGKFQEIQARRLVPGDIIKLRIGSIVPADVKLFDTGYVTCDQSMITGESLPQTHTDGDVCFANTIVTEGEMLCICINTGVNTYFGNTIKLVAKAEKERKSHFQKMIITVGNWLIAVTVVLSIIVLIVGIYRGETFVELATYVLVLTISAIPVALPAVLTVTMAIGALKLSKKNVVVSNLSAIEELSGVDVLCIDKTGTLTSNNLVIEHIIPEENFTINQVVLYAALASRKENGDVIEKPIFDKVKELNIEQEFAKYAQKDYIPFNPIDKKTQITVFDGEKEMIVLKGAPQVIVSRCGTFLKRKTLLDKVEQYAKEGYRSLGVAVEDVVTGQYDCVGFLYFIDPPKSDSAEMIKKINDLVVDVKMVTGDNIAISKHIANLLNIGSNIKDTRTLHGNLHEEYHILTSVVTQALYTRISKDIFEQLELHAEDEQKQEIFATMKADIIKKDSVEQVSQEIADNVVDLLDDENVSADYVRQHESEIIKAIEDADGFAQVVPEDKYNIVKYLQSVGHIVGMTGDGVNDAPALQKADVGIAVDGASDAARSAADVILLSSGVSVIWIAVRESRQIFERMKGYATFRIAETIRIIVFMSLAIIVFNIYPITATMIIILALLNDIPILAIAYDNTKIRKHPMTWNMKEMFSISSVLGLAGVVSSFLLLYILLTYLELPLPMIQSIFFAKLVVAGHGTIYNTRIDEWFWKKPHPSGILFSATFVSRVVGTVIAVYGFSVMEPIGWKWAIFVWAYALMWFFINDIAKMVTYNIIRRNKHHKK